MSIVKDLSLSPSGLQKIQWVRDFMPALGGIEARFEQEQPFAGLRVAVSVHLEAKTANLGYVLAKGGAEVRLTGSNPLSTQVFASWLRWSNTSCDICTKPSSSASAHCASGVQSGYLAKWLHTESCQFWV